MPSIQQEALESSLESLLSYSDEEKICVICLGVLSEKSCMCARPAWWPIASVIRRIEIQLGRAA